MFFAYCDMKAENKKTWVCELFRRIRAPELNFSFDRTVYRLHSAPVLNETYQTIFFYIQQC